MKKITLLSLSVIGVVLIAWFTYALTKGINLRYFKDNIISIVQDYSDITLNFSDATIMFDIHSKNFIITVHNAHINDYYNHQASLTLNSGFLLNNKNIIKEVILQDIDSVLNYDGAIANIDISRVINYVLDDYRLELLDNVDTVSLRHITLQLNVIDNNEQYMMSIDEVSINKNIDDTLNIDIAGIFTNKNRDNDPTSITASISKTNHNITVNIVANTIYDEAITTFFPQTLLYSTNSDAIYNSHIIIHISNNNNIPHIDKATAYLTNISNEQHEKLTAELHQQNDIFNLSLSGENILTERIKHLTQSYIAEHIIVHDNNIIDNVRMTASFNVNELHLLDINIKQHNTLSFSHHNNNDVKHITIDDANMYINYSHDNINIKGTSTINTIPFIIDKAVIQDSDNYDIQAHSVDLITDKFLNSINLPLSMFIERDMFYNEHASLAIRAPHIYINKNDGLHNNFHITGHIEHSRILIPNTTIPINIEKADIVINTKNILLNNASLKVNNIYADNVNFNAHYNDNIFTINGIFHGPSDDFIRYLANNDTVHTITSYKPMSDNITLNIVIKGDFETINYDNVHLVATSPLISWQPTNDKLLFINEYLQYNHHVNTITSHDNIFTLKDGVISYTGHAVANNDPHNHAYNITLHYDDTLNIAWNGMVNSAFINNRLYNNSFITVDKHSMISLSGRYDSKKSDSISLYVDITNMAIYQHHVNYIKDSGKEAHIDMTLLNSHEQPNLWSLTLTYDDTHDAKLTTTMALNNGVVTQANINVKLANIIQGHIDYIYKNRQNHTINATLDYMNITHIINNQPNNDSNNKYAVFTMGLPQKNAEETLNITAHIKQAIISENIIYNNVTTRYTERGNIMNYLHIEDTLKILSISYNYNHNTGETHLDSMIPNLGETLRAMNISQRLYDGNLIINAKRATMEDTLKGTIVIENFYMQKLGVIAKLLEVASITGTNKALSRNGVTFQSLLAHYNYDNGIALMDKVAIKGDALAMFLKGDINLNNDSIDMVGTLVPAYSWLSWLDYIPIISSIVPIEGENALVGVRFDIKDTLSNPNISTYPLSLLTPSYLRQVFNLDLKADLSDTHYDVNK